MKRFLTATASCLFALCANASADESVRYGAPSQYDVLESVRSEFARRAGLTYYATWGLDLSMRPNYPMDVQIYKCDWQIDGKIPGEGFSPTLLDGYRCVVEIFPNAAANYRTYGFFYHNGMSWRYYGALGPQFVIPVDEFDNGDTPVRQTPKPGSVLYDGQPYGKHNLDNPYEDILNSYPSSAYDYVYGGG